MNWSWYCWSTINSHLIQSQAWKFPFGNCDWPLKIVENVPSRWYFFDNNTKQKDCRYFLFVHFFLFRENYIVKKRFSLACIISFNEWLRGTLNQQTNTSLKSTTRKNNKECYEICSKLTKWQQNGFIDIVLVSLLFSLDIFHTFF